MPPLHVHWVPIQVLSKSVNTVRGGFYHLTHKFVFFSTEIEPILVGETEDLEIGSVENFEYEDNNFAIFRRESGFFSTQGNCNCEERAPLSEAEIEAEELECVGCGNTYSIVSGDCISEPELDALRIYDIYEEDGNIYLSL